MTKALFCLLGILPLAACSTSTYSLAEQCAHEPGCVSTFQNGKTKIPQLIAIEASNAGKWETVIHDGKSKKKKK